MYATVIAKGVTDFANNCELLKYGLHWDAVTSRWARELANEVGALDVTKNCDIYRSFYILFIKFPFIFPRLQNYYISSDFPNFFAEKVINSLYTLHLTPAAPLPIKPTFPIKKGG